MIVRTILLLPKIMSSLRSKNKTYFEVCREIDKIICKKYNNPKNYSNIYFKILYDIS